MLSYVLPTRNRPDDLARTLREIGRLDPAGHDRLGGAEVVVVDDASDEPARSPGRLANGIEVVLRRLDRSVGAAARNEGVRSARGSWIVMLDDDSHPTGLGHVDVLADASADVAAIGADIRLERGGREAGGLPEVGIGCGLAIRRSVFLELGGYDPAFHYYVEEYDLAARLVATGRRTVHDVRFGVRHRKIDAGRDMNVILGRLVRNNGWVMARYAPHRLRDGLITATIDRYRAIAEREGATAGFERGLAELERTLDEQPRRALDRAQWDRFVGRTAARAGLAAARRAAAIAGRPLERVHLVGHGKHADVVEAAAREAGLEPTDDPSVADADLVATLSPGPMLDAFDRRRAAADRPVLRAWSPLGLRDAPFAAASFSRAG